MANDKKTVALLMQGVSKKYPGTLAVDNVDFDVLAGEVHALVGENGAGKSTLMKMLAGSFNDYTGQIFVNGKEVKLYTPSKAKEEGIAMIYQELSLAVTRSIAENILVGRLPGGKIFADKKQIIQRTKKALERVRLQGINPLTLVNEISQHEAQLVEIAKAVDNNPHIIVMDEPTSSLTQDEVKILFEIVRELKKSGLAIIYISHHLSEVFEIADRVTVMRDGKKQGTYNVSDVNAEKLAELMIGSAVRDFTRGKGVKIGKEVISVKNLTRIGFFHNVSFDVKKGEILGLSGLGGSGRTEIARTIVGADKLDSGEIIFEGKSIKPKNMSEMLSLGVSYLTESRKIEGLAIRLPLEINVLSTLIDKNSKGVVHKPSMSRELLKELINELVIVPKNPSIDVANLSGGNQQKVLLAKWLARKPKLLILDEPTRGVDVGAKKVIHEAIEKLAMQGIAVLLISSDLPELVSLSDRIIVLRQGYLVGELEKGNFNEETVLLAANGERGVLSVEY